MNIFYLLVDTKDGKAADMLGGLHGIVFCWRCCPLSSQVVKSTRHLPPNLTKKWSHNSKSEDDQGRRDNLRQLSDV